MRETVKRNESVEIYRIVLMLGIVLFHAINNCGHNWWFSGNLYWCTASFAVISGHFGIKFSFAKVFRLYGVAFYACIVSYIIRSLFLESAPISIGCFIVHTVNLFRNGWWFLHAYVVLMALSPIAEKALAEGSNTRLTNSANRHDAVIMVFPFLLVVFAWGFLVELNHFKPYIPKSSGVQAISGFTLWGIYLIGRLDRLFKIFDGWRTWHWVLLFIALSFVVPQRFGFYSSPFVLFQSIAMFKIFTRIKFMNHSKCMFLGAWVAKSCFAIYLLHANQYGIALMTKVENLFLVNGIPLFASQILAASLIFVVALIADMPRRILLRYVSVLSH